MSLKNHVVVLTGASSGIGRATALRFAKRKASVVLASRREEALNELAAECERLGGSALVVPTDTTKTEEVDALAAAAVGRFGRIDVWVNSAAVSVFSPFLDMPLEDFRRVLDVGILGYVYGSRAALQVMTAQGRGALINISSVVGEIAQPYTAPYGMAKAAVRALDVSLRGELRLAGHKKVTVSTVLPPTIDTPFFRHSGNYTGREVVAMPPVYPPDLVAKAIVDLAEHPRDEVVVGAAGKALVKAHRASPSAVEAQMAAQTEKGQLSRKRTATDTAGTIYSPAPTSDAEITGGWHGKKKTRKRILGVAFLAGAGIAVRQLLRGRR